jgi:putative hydrolase of the HAD superfamily
MKAVLFDFFGTLVNYSDSRTEQGYIQTHNLLSKAGIHLSYEHFLKEWSHSHERYDRYSVETGLEYNMEDVSGHFFERHAPEHLYSGLPRKLWRSFIDEWASGIRRIDGVPEFLRRISSTLRVGVVSNTHCEELVHDQLKRAGIHQFVHLVVTSVSHGRPKPHPSIFMSALEGIGCAAHETLFVGDSYAADYQGATGVGMPALLIAPGGHSLAPASDVISSVLEVESYITDRQGTPAPRMR